MAPPTGRKTGTNKRAQLGIFAGYLAATVGALIGAVLLIVSLWSPQTFAGLRSMAGDLASPVGEAGATTRSGGRDFFTSIAGYYRAGSRNAELEEEARIARVKLAEAEAIAQENARLKALIGLAEEAEDPVAMGRLIGSTSSSLRRIAFLSVGRRDGVRPGMTVSSPLGLVGRVIESGSASSRVLLLTDGQSVVPVRRATDDVVALAEGRSDGSIRLRLINLGINPIKQGDVFVTSGAGGLFRPGTAVAVASEIVKDGAIAHLVSNPAATDFVVVEQPWHPEALVPTDQPLPVDPTDATPDTPETGTP